MKIVNCLLLLLCLGKSNLLSAQTPKPKKLPYIIARNYFVKNTFTKEQLSNNLIDNQVAFGQIFGMASFMGKNGKPTPIDFNQQFAIAIIPSSTNHSFVLKPISLTSENKQLVLRYHYQENKDTLSYTMQPYLLLVVDKKYKAKVVLQRD